MLVPIHPDALARMKMLRDVSDRSAKSLPDPPDGCCAAPTSLPAKGTIFTTERPSHGTDEEKSHV